MFFFLKTSYQTQLYSLLANRSRRVKNFEVLRYQAESDFIQCQTKMRAFASRIYGEFKQIVLNWNRIVHQNALLSLVFSTTRPWNKQISAPGAGQPSSQERWQVADLKSVKNSYIFSLPRISTKVFLCCQSFDRRGQWNFLKIRVIQDKSKPTRVAVIWLRVKVNRTRLCRVAHFARNEIKYQKSRESGVFQYNLYARTIACLSFILLYKQKFYECYSLSPS